MTPAALAVAPLATEAKMPLVVTAAGTSIITERSPYIARTSFTLAQSSVIIADWAAKNGIKKVVTMVSDYAPGVDAEKSFKEQFTKAGGQVVESIRFPLANPDFAPFLQRAGDAKPDAIFVFVPSGQGAAFVKQFIERGLDKAGIKLIGPGDVTDDDHGERHGRPGDRNGDRALLFRGAPVADEQGLGRSVQEGEQRLAARTSWRSSGYDGMHLIYEALKKTGGKTDGDSLIAAMKGMKWESPRGPISIDPETRDIIQNIYIRRDREGRGASSTTSSSRPSRRSRIR